MTTLYELTGQFLAVSEMADDPKMVDAVADTLDGIEGEIQDKAQAIVQVQANMHGDMDAIDCEIKRLQARKQIISNRVQRLKDYLLINMVSTGISKIECPLFSITLPKARPMVDVVEESLIPEKYIKTTVSTVPVKAEILKALKAGEDVPGCRLGESKRSIKIK